MLPLSGETFTDPQLATVTADVALSVNAVSAQLTLKVETVTDLLQ